MATTTKQATAATKKAAAKATKKVTSPAKAIGDAAAGLEHDIVAALRQELKHLKKTVATIQKDLRTALDRVETALGTVADSAPSANGRATKAAAKKPVAKKAAAKKTAAKKPVVTGRSK